MSGGDAQAVAAAIGVISMIVARLLDWYFPIQKSRRRPPKEKK